MNENKVLELICSLKSLKQIEILAITRRSIHINYRSPEDNIKVIINDIISGTDAIIFRDNMLDWFFAKTTKFSDITKWPPFLIIDTGYETIPSYLEDIHPVLDKDFEILMGKLIIKNDEERNKYSFKKELSEDIKDIEF